MDKYNKMKTSIKYILSAIIVMGAIFLLTQCKSPAPQTSAVAPLADTTALADTMPIAVKPDTISTAPVKHLTLIVTNLATETGPVVVGIYGTKNKFPDPKNQLKEYKFTPHGKQLTAQITDMPFGTYALAIYQDVNRNGKIDKNLIGIPTEPYAFSKNYKPTIKAPAFKDCSFSYANNDTITMKMIR